MEYRSSYEDLHHEEEKARDARQQEMKDRWGNCGHADEAGQVRDHQAQPRRRNAEEWHRIADEASLRLTALVRKRLTIEETDAEAN